jgi:hypothetical protein
MSLFNLSNIHDKDQSKECLIPSKALEFNKCIQDSNNGSVSSSCPLSLITKSPKDGSLHEKINPSCSCDSVSFLKDQNDFFSSSETRNEAVYKNSNQEMSSSPKVLRRLRSNSLLNNESKKIPVTSSEPFFSTNLDFTINHNSKVQDNFVQATNKLPTFDRWRLYCFRFAFILEPNIPQKGIRYTYTLSELCRPEGLRCRNDILLDLLEEKNSDNPPLLILFRFTNEVVQTSHYDKTLLERVGYLECVYFIDAFLGCLSIHNTRFLVVVCDSEIVSGFNRNSFQIEHDSTETLETSIEDIFIYRIRQSCLIPFNIPFSTHFRTLENRRMYSPANNILTCDHRQFSENFVNCRSKTRILDVEPFKNRLIDRERKFYLENSHDELINCHFYKEETSEPERNNLSFRKSLTTHDLLEFSIPAHQRVPIMRLQCGDSNVYTTLVYNHLGDKVGNHKQNVENLLATSFYYSYDTDITNTLQRKRQLQIPFYSQKWPCSYDPFKTINHRDHNTGATSPCNCDIKISESVPPSVENSENDSVNVCLWDVADQRFVWNWELVKPFLNCSIDFRWTVPIIQGINLIFFSLRQILTYHIFFLRVYNECLNSICFGWN